MASDVDEAKAAAIGEVRRRWVRLGDGIGRLDRE